MNGLHYSDALAGRVFWQQTRAAAIAGLAIPIYSGTSVEGGAPIYNPTDSNRNVELVSYDVVYASGTGAATFMGVFLMVGKVTAIGTSTGCSAFNSHTPYNALMPYAGNASRIMSSNGSAVVTVTAGTATPPVQGVVGAGAIRSIFSTNIEAATGTAHGTIVCRYTFDGTAILPPGTICYLAGIVASVSLYNITNVWKEMPINPLGP